MPTVKLTLHTGNASAHASLLAEHRKLKTWLEQTGPSYGLPSSLSELDEVGIETLESIYPVSIYLSLPLSPDTAQEEPTFMDGERVSSVHRLSLELIIPSSSQATNSTPTPLPVTPPPSLTLLPLLINLSDSPGLKKTRENFLALASSPSKYKSRYSPFPPLSYLSPMGSKVFRIEGDFVAQMGDVTRGDGSGGESIYGETFNDEKEGLKIPFQLGTVAMASGSSKNSNTSQFFVTLTSSPTQLAKLMGKYVAFAQIDVSVPSHREALERLAKLENGKAGTKEPVWIGGMEVIE